MRRAAACAGGLCLLVTSAAIAVESHPSEVGAYCPLPETGETPECLVPAQERYGEFFDSLESGGSPDASVVEAKLASPIPNEETYLALSSLTYGYLRLAQRAAADPNADPALVARLDRWNEVLAASYAGRPDDLRFQRAVRRAAADLHERAPTLSTDCDSSAGDDCRPTSPLMRAFAALDNPSTGLGVRGPLSRLIARLLGQVPPSE